MFPTYRWLLATAFVALVACTAALAEPHDGEADRNDATLRRELESASVTELATCGGCTWYQNSSGGIVLQGAPECGSGCTSTVLIGLYNKLKLLGVTSIDEGAFNSTGLAELTWLNTQYLSSNHTYIEQATSLSGVIWYSSLTIKPSTTVACTSGCQILILDDCNIQGVIQCNDPLCAISIKAGNISISASGRVKAGDVNIQTDQSIDVAGDITSDGLGYGSGSGTGRGYGPQKNDGSSIDPSTFIGSGGGGGHGGMGAYSCHVSGSRIKTTIYGAGTTYGSSSQPNTFGSSGGSGDFGDVNPLTAPGSAGGGRIFVRGGSIHVESGATISANGQPGVSKSVTVTWYPSYNSQTVTRQVAGGGGSGGSIWLVSTTGGISGEGSLEAIGGITSQPQYSSASQGSGSGGGGRISLNAATSVSATSLSLRTSRSTICPGAAGTIYISDSMGIALVVDGIDNDLAVGIETPYPWDLHGRLISKFETKGNARVSVSGTSTNNNIASSSIVVGPDAQLSGDFISIAATNVTVDGIVASTLQVRVRAVGNGHGNLTIGKGGSMSCVGCTADIKLGRSGLDSVLRLEGEMKIATLWLSTDLVLVDGSSALLQANGDVIVDAGEVAISQGSSVSFGATAVNANVVFISQGSSVSFGAVSVEAKTMDVVERSSITVSGASSLPSSSGAESDHDGHVAMRLLLSERLVVQAGSGVVCSGNGCSAVEVSARDVTIGGNLKCVPSMCSIGVFVEGNASVTGSLEGGDVNLTAQCGVLVAGKITSDGLGYGSGSGPGNGTRPLVDPSCGGGGGHGGMGANSCYSGTVPKPYGAGTTYGSSTQPNTFGSGGGPGEMIYSTSSWSQTRTASGGAGGGRIFVRGGSIHVEGGATISANGRSGSSTSGIAGGGGSGGSIWLVSTTGGISGEGSVEAVGGSSRTPGSGAGGGGRISLNAATSVSASLSRTVEREIGTEVCFAEDGRGTSVSVENVDFPCMLQCGGCNFSSSLSGSSSSSPLDGSLPSWLNPTAADCFASHECNETRSWKTIFSTGKQQGLSTGGFRDNRLLQLGWASWVCWEQHACLSYLRASNDGDLMCYAWHKTKQIFHPMGFNSDLNLKVCTGASCTKTQRVIFEESDCAAR